MRRVWFIVAMTLLMMGFAAGFIVSGGADTSEMIRVYRNLIQVQVNGSPVTMDNFLYNKRTYVPMREVAELLGKDVRWNAYTKTAGIDDMVYEGEALAALLPSETGYTWIYSGFAEYGHTMTLDRIEAAANRRTYVVSGEIEDSSGGEATFDRSLQLSYVLQGNAMVQVLAAPRMLDSRFDRLTLTETPLVAGTTWTETLTDRTGRWTKLDAIIEKVEVVDGKKQYTIRHQEVGTSYYELRVIREGAGVIAFEKLLQLTDEAFPVSYSLYMGGQLTEVSLTLYFATPNADGLLPESRTMLVADGAVAKAAVMGLIWGPQSDNLRPTIPDGTRLLGVSIADGICTVDFSREFVDNHPGGSAGEIMTLSSILETLKQFPSIDKVQILVEGQKGATLGNVLLDKPLE
ncbi:GerMN domain-containing protein [Acidaminobacter hydrogenoformans]|uniref:Copper amine oxidase N-terminal domain-containing protein n=1 Tax=Acidaminobacter hydrogenoformans DSM 2784 TaxID=1120920 RepID=A0A1G5RY03_9FIRM|nr:GerMN domain-containing protein [Acidaminobacter hydrogenoformans]SCZ78209.1 Copper amine oxidase N-terminal domain-containing protein [Acidaminobacter hydrogenoformans DSM 2784]